MHVLDPEKVIAVWTVPNKGIMFNKPVNEIPPDGLFNGSNVLVRSAQLRPRSGFTSVISVGMDGTPTGFYNGRASVPAFQPDAFQNDAFQTQAGVTGLLGTTREIYNLVGTTATEITGTNLTANSHQLARFTSIYLQATQQLNVAHVNGVDANRIWPSTGNFVLMGGSPPIFKDIASIADHLVGITMDGFTVRWSNNQDPNTWPALNFKNVTDTADPTVAIQSMGVLGGVLFKTRSLWSIYPQGGTEASFFLIQYRGSYDGPASPAAVVDANGNKYWMTDEGRVGAFDGSIVRWVGDGVWPLVKPEIDPNNADRIFGYYEPTFKEVWFWYFHSDGTSRCVIIILPRPQDGIDDFIAFYGKLAYNFPITAGGDQRLSTRKSIVAFDINATALVAAADGQDDLGFGIPSFWQTGLQKTPGVGVFSLDAVETFFERVTPTDGPVSSTLTPRFSYILSEASGTPGSPKTIDVTTANPANVIDYKGNDLRGRFWGLTFDFVGPMATAGGTYPYFKFRGARLGATFRKG